MKRLKYINKIEINLFILSYSIATGLVYFSLSELFNFNSYRLEISLIIMASIFLISKIFEFYVRYQNNHKLAHKKFLNEYEEVNLKMKYRILVNKNDFLNDEEKKLLDQFNFVKSQNNLNDYEYDESPNRKTLFVTYRNGKIEIFNDLNNMNFDNCLAYPNEYKLYVDKNSRASYVLVKKTDNNKYQYFESNQSGMKFNNETSLHQDTKSKILLITIKEIIGINCDHKNSDISTFI